MKEQRLFQITSIQKQGFKIEILSTERSFVTFMIAEEDVEDDLCIGKKKIQSN